MLRVIQGIEINTPLDCGSQFGATRCGWDFFDCRPGSALVPRAIPGLEGATPLVLGRGCMNLGGPAVVPRFPPSVAAGAGECGANLLLEFGSGAITFWSIYEKMAEFGRNGRGRFAQRQNGDRGG